MDTFIEKFGFILYYVVISSVFLIYYSSKYKINISNLGLIKKRFDIINRGKKFWLVVLIAIILLMSLPSILFPATFEYDWIRIVSQVILIAIILFRYMIVAIYFGDYGMYLFDDLIYWDNVNKYTLEEHKDYIRLVFYLNDNRTKRIDFPLYLKKDIEMIIHENLKLI